MSCFASVYIQDNPNLFTNYEIPYILAYSIVMLNTDLHSEKILE